MAQIHAFVRHNLGEAAAQRISLNKLFRAEGHRDRLVPRARSEALPALPCRATSDSRDRSPVRVHQPGADRGRHRPSCSSRTPIVARREAPPIGPATW